MSQNPCEPRLVHAETRAFHFEKSLLAPTATDQPCASLEASNLNSLVAGSTASNPLLSAVISSGPCAAVQLNCVNNGTVELWLCDYLARYHFELLVSCLFLLRQCVPDFAVVAGTCRSPR